MDAENKQTQTNSFLGGFKQNAGSGGENSTPWYRPFQPGEFVSNPDGSRSTERTVTFEMDGKFVNVPSLWMGKYGPVRLTDQEHIYRVMDDYERGTGKRFKRFNSIEDALDVARKRTISGGAASGPLAE